MDEYFSEPEDIFPNKLGITDRQELSLTTVPWNHLSGFIRASSTHRRRMYRAARVRAAFLFSWDQPSWRTCKAVE